MFAPENGQSLKFKIGDRIVYTNPQGVKFNLKVTGFYKKMSNDDAMYAKGARYLLDWDCPWYPAEEKRMELAGK